MRRGADTQVIVVGGGQAGFAAGFYLRRLGLDFVILDAQPEPGGAWPHAWDQPPTHHCPASACPPQPGVLYPDAAHVVFYLTDYEKYYQLPVERPVRVHGTHRSKTGMTVETDEGTWTDRKADI